MFKRILYKLFINLFPETLMFVGSLLLGFSLKLINTETLWEEEGVVNGGVSMGDVAMNIPAQNDPLFWWGLSLFLIGSFLEFIKIVHHTLKEELKATETVRVCALPEEALAETESPDKTNEEV